MRTLYIRGLFLGLLASAYGGAVLAENPQSAMVTHSVASPQVTLQAEAGMEVPFDRITIYLATEQSGARQEVVDKALRKTIDAALNQAKKQSSVEVSSESYRIYPTTNDKGQISGWRGRAELKLKSSDFQAASNLAAELDTGLSIARWEFSLSPEALTQHTAKLIQQAFSNFEQRASLISQSAGFKSYQYEQLNVETPDTNTVRPYFAKAMMATAESSSLRAADAASGPTIEGGSERIRVTIHGTIKLSDAAPTTTTKPDQPES